MYLNIILQKSQGLRNKCLEKQAIIIMILYTKKKNTEHSLTTTVYNLLQQIISNLIERKLNYHQPVEEAAFKKGYCTNCRLLKKKILIE